MARDAGLVGEIRAAVEDMERIAGELGVLVRRGECALTPGLGLRDVVPPTMDYGRVKIHICSRWRIVGLVSVVTDDSPGPGAALILPNHLGAFALEHCTA